MPNLKYMYVRNEYKKRDVSIVSDLVEEDGNYFVKCGWTFRHKQDKFIKREGRKLALERMNSGDKNYSTKFQIEPERVKFFDIAAEILSNILSKESTPRMYAEDILWDMEYYAFNALDDDQRIDLAKKMWESKQIISR